MNHAYQRRTSATVLAVLLALLLSGCAATSPQFEGQFGQSVRAAVAQQSLDPAAARNTNPVNGMDGAAARATYMSYQGSYHAPAPAPASIIGTSGK